MAIDHLLIVPFEPANGAFVTPGVRRSAHARVHLEFLQALSRFEAFVGRSLGLSGEGDDLPLFGGAPVRAPQRRSLASVALATHLERAGLTWASIDPGERPVSWWRRELQRQPDEPRTVGISTTFLQSHMWIRSLIQTVREIFPRSRIILGGYYYASDTHGFLSLDADVYCVGTAEVRLPTIIERLNRGEALDDIPGLFFRRDGRLVSTGPDRPTDLQDLAPPDWRLSERISPPLRPLQDYVVMNVETQRGCVFKCAFCTHRTLTLHDTVSVERAVARIMDTRIFRHGIIALTDSTATFPHDRWEAVLDGLLARGGSPHPIWAFGRVTDLDDGRVERMARAGVRAVFVGQESGDQNILNKMSKGTRVEHVAPAVRAMSRHGIIAEIGMIHGFPGETPDTCAASRNLLKGMNRGFDTPVALMYWLSPFVLQNFAAVSSPTLRSEALKDREAAMPMEQLVLECVRTVCEVSKVDGAPVLGILTAPYVAAEIADHPGRKEIYRHLKAVDRAIGMFLEAEHFGVPIDWKALGQLRSDVLAAYPHRGSRVGRIRSLYGARTRSVFLRRLRREWVAEASQGKPGWLTKTTASWMTLVDRRAARPAWAAFAEAQIDGGTAPPTTAGVQELASALVSDSVHNASRVKLKVVRDDP